MPKRPSTPPPGDDEPRYLSVLYPYPPEVNMEIRGEVIALVRWVACCMGGFQDLYAVFHKPSTSNMVLLEVNRHYPDFGKLIGAHKWSDFVLNPGTHHDKVTRIYFCTLANVRAVEKAGWKCVSIDDDWFKDFIPNNRYIAYPYPPSTYCDPPTEDYTNYKLCRPIPRTLFELPVPTPPPVPVGSPAWIAQKEASTTPSLPRKSYASASTVLPGAEPRRSQIISPPNMSRPSVASPLGPTRNGLLGYNSIDPEDDECSQSAGCLSGYYQSSSSLTEDFGTLTINPPTAAAKEPLCITHQIVCKEKVCCDYWKQLKQIERDRLKEELAASGRGMRGSGRSFATRGFDRGRGRGTGDGKDRSRRGGRGGRGGREVQLANNAKDSPPVSLRGRGVPSVSPRGRGVPSVSRRNARSRGSLLPNTRTHVS